MQEPKLLDRVHRWWRDRLVGRNSTRLHAALLERADFVMDRAQAEVSAMRIEVAQARSKVEHIEPTLTQKGGQ